MLDLVLVDPLGPGLPANQDQRKQRRGDELQCDDGAHAGRGGTQRCDRDARRAIGDGGADDGQVGDGRVPPCGGCRAQHWAGKAARGQRGCQHPQHGPETWPLRHRDDGWRRAEGIRSGARFVAGKHLRIVARAVRGGRSQIPAGTGSHAQPVGAAAGQVEIGADAGSPFGVCCIDLQVVRSGSQWSQAQHRRLSLASRGTRGLAVEQHLGWTAGGDVQVGTVSR